MTEYLGIWIVSISGILFSGFIFITWSLDIYEKARKSDCDMIEIIPGILSVFSLIIIFFVLGVLTNNQFSKWNENNTNCLISATEI